jgi:hypothetical protein
MGTQEVGYKAKPIEARNLGYNPCQREMFPKMSPFLHENF